MIKHIRNIYQNFLACMVFYLRSFYDPSLYRDVAYRTEGYGLKKLIFVMFILMLPSFFVLCKQALTEYGLNWRPNISELPFLKLTKNHELLYKQQNFMVSDSINHNIFEWANDDTKQEFQQTGQHPLILGNHCLWARLSSMNYFGFNLVAEYHYLPIFSWHIISPPVFGKTILEMLNVKMVIYQLISLFVFALSMNCFMLIFSIRSIAFLAMKMVLLVLTESLEYKMTCRLLSISAMPSLTIIFLISWFKTSPPAELKLGLVFIYMFNFYIALRCIKARSHFRILKHIGQ
jgi:hypothetical protein